MFGGASWGFGMKVEMSLILGDNLPRRAMSAFSPILFWRIELAWDLDDFVSERAFFRLGLGLLYGWIGGDGVNGGGSGVGETGRGGRTVVLLWKWTCFVDVGDKDSSGGSAMSSVIIAVCTMQTELFLCRIRTGWFCNHLDSRRLSCQVLYSLKVAGSGTS